MNKKTHRVYIVTLISINVFVLMWLVYEGISYYNTPIVDRFFHKDHQSLKPSGPFGHGYGIVGSLLILIGVFSYIAKKKYRFLASLGRLKYWLEFHIFLCTLGPMLILFHTAFKFGGIVSISFWSMLLVVLSGVIGRFIYIQIPRTIEGRELSLQEAKEMKKNIGDILRTQYRMDEVMIARLTESTQLQQEEKPANRFNAWIKTMQEDRINIRNIRVLLKSTTLELNGRNKILKLVREEISLNRKIERLLFMQSLFRHWHVIHLPFALIMLIIMIIHVIVTISLGYQWIF